MRLLAKLSLYILGMGAIAGVGGGAFYSGYDSGRVDKISAQETFLGRTANQAAVRQCFNQSQRPEIVACVEREVRLGRDDVRSEQDLKAQLAMARWAGWLLLASILQFAVGALGLAALVGTVMQNRRTLEHAEAALQHAKDTAAKELRPYVFIESCEIEEIDDRGEKQNVDVAFTFKNSGIQTAEHIPVTFDVRIAAIPVVVAALPASNNKVIIPLIARDHCRKIATRISVDPEQLRSIRDRRSGILCRIAWECCVAGGLNESRSESYIFTAEDMGGRRARVLTGEFTASVSE